MAQFTPEIDRQIIAGFWADQEAMLRVLAAGGFSEEAVFHRAEKIGVIQRRSSHPAALEVALLVRQCLRCDEVFVAQGRFNRVCRRCRARD